MHRESLHDTIIRLMRMMSHAEGVSFPLHTDSPKLRGNCLHPSPRTRVASPGSLVTTGNTPRRANPGPIPKRGARLHVVPSVLQSTFQSVFTFLSLKSQKNPQKYIYFIKTKTLFFFSEFTFKWKENISKLEP